MMFKQAVSEQSLNSPVPGNSGDPMPDPSIIVENDGTPVPAATPVVVVTNPEVPVVVKVPEVPVVVKVPEVPVVVKVPEVPVVVKVPEVPVVVKVPEVPVVVKVPEVPVVVKVPEVVAEEITYPESEIPVCKLNIEFNGMGSAARMAIASAPKADLMNYMMEGFDTLSASELAAMRTAADKMVSANGVQVLKDGQSFNKNGLSKDAKVLIVTDGKAAVDVKLNGMGKGAQIYVMNVADKHNTVCVRANGVTASSKFFETVKSDTAYVSRGMIDVNGSGGSHTFLKLTGGNQSGLSYKGNGMSDSSLMVRMDGRNDSFVSLEANGISNSLLDFKIKGLDDTGLGIKANGISKSDIKIEMQGRDDVKIMMDVNGMSNNEVSGWIKAKSGAKVDPSMSDFIEIMPLP